MSTRPQTSPSVALSTLQTWLSDGSLATAVTEHKLGSELDEVRSALRAGKADLVRVKAVGQAADLISAVPWEPVREHVMRLKSAGKDLKNARTHDDLYEWRRVQWKFVRDAATVLEQTLKEAWRRKCAEPFGDHERLGAALSYLPRLKALGSEMKTTAQEGKDLGNHFPPSAGQRTKLAALIDRATAERQNLTKRGASEEISGLLLAAAEDRATLADLTPEAFEWLRTNNALTLFELRLARTTAR